MEFLTLHELSLQLDVSVRVLRHRLRQLLQAGKLTEPQDCRRDDFVDDTHFVWRVNPVTFMQATGLHVATNPVSHVAPVDNRTVNPPPPPVTQPVSTGDQPLPRVETKPSGLEREIIDLLKDQVRVKDVQIADLTEQNKTVNSMNLKLTGQVVQQAAKIQSLLELPAGRVESKEGTPKGPTPVDANFSDPNTGEHLDHAA